MSVGENYREIRCRAANMGYFPGRERPIRRERLGKTPERGLMVNKFIRVQEMKLVEADAC